MEYSVESLSLLFTLQEYIPYMSTEELLAILWYGMKPDNATINGWELKRRSREATIERRLREAISRQK